MAKKKSDPAWMKDAVEVRYIETKPSVEMDPLPSTTGPDSTDAKLAGGAQGLTQGLVDEVGAAVTAPVDAGAALLRQAGILSPKTDSMTGAAVDPQSEPTDLLHYYRRNRDTSRLWDKRAKEAHPVDYTAAEVGSDLVGQASLAGLTGGASLTPAGQAAVGAVSGLGRSQADLTKGEVGRAALDAGTSATVSGLLTKAGASLTNALKSRAAKGVEKATQDAATKAATAVEKNLASLKGTAGAETQAGSRMLENIQRESENVSPDLKKLIKTLMDNGEVQALREGVIGSNVASLPQQAAKAAAAKAELAAATATKDAAINQGKEQILGKGLKEIVGPRAATYASRFVPIAVGTTIGGPLGAAAGLATSAALGRPGTALANMIKEPAFRKAAWSTIEKVAANQPERLGKFGAMVTRLGSPDLVDYFVSKNPDDAAEWEQIKAQIAAEEEQQAVPRDL